MPASLRLRLSNAGPLHSQNITGATRPLDVELAAKVVYGHQPHATGVDDHHGIEIHTKIH